MSDKEAFNEAVLSGAVEAWHLGQGIWVTTRGLNDWERFTGTRPEFGSNQWEWAVGPPMKTQKIEWTKVIKGSEPEGFVLGKYGNNYITVMFDKSISEWYSYVNVVQAPSHYAVVE